VTVPFSRLARWIAGFTERHGAVLVGASADTVLLVGADGARAWLAVPFPPLPSSPDPVHALLEHTQRRRLVGVLLVRRGGHAVGIFDGSILVASKVDSSYVQGRTKAGGWSQQRFARRRANQAAAAFSAAADDAARVLAPQSGSLDALVCGGDAAAVDAVLADRRLVDVAALRTGPMLSVPDPRLRVLRATPDQFLAVRIRLDP
jgi:hypothetical protein